MGGISVLNSVVYCSGVRRERAGLYLLYLLNECLFGVSSAADKLSELSHLCVLSKSLIFLCYVFRERLVVEALCFHSVVSLAYYSLQIGSTILLKYQNLMCDTTRMYTIRFRTV